MKLLFIDPNPNPIADEYFWKPVVEYLNSHGHYAVLTKTIAVDSAKFDVIIGVYLAQHLNDITANLATLPVIGVGMGTDTISGAVAQVKTEKLAGIITFNKEHAQMIKEARPNVNVAVQDWFATESKLEYKARPYPHPKDQPIRIVNIALHRYMKGLDNIMQMLFEMSPDILQRLELHVVGEVMDNYLRFFVKHLQDRAPYKSFFHGPVHPKEIDHLIESINPTLYLSGSQGECGATTLIESMFKGIKCLVQSHPFHQGVYKDAPLYTYTCASQLNAQIENALTDKVTSEELNRYATGRFRMATFCDNLIRNIRYLISGESR